MDENKNENIEVSESEVQSNMQGNSEPKGLYIASLILGICAIIFGWIPIFGQILAIVALIIGIVAILKMKKCNSKNGMAIAGLVTSIIGFILGIIITAIIVLTGAVIYDKASEVIEENDLNMDDVYETTSNFIESTVDDFSETEIDMYNSTFESYEGNSENGTSVRRLIDEIISNNESYAGDGERFVSIEVDDITGFDDDALDDACEKANPYEGGNNSSSNVDDATAEMNELRSKIVNSNRYTVDMVYSDGFVVEVEISEQ